MLKIALKDTANKWVRERMLREAEYPKLYMYFRDEYDAILESQKVVEEESEEEVEQTNFTSKA